MQHHRHPSWSVEEHETREQGVWIARLVSSILAAGWSAFWMGLACVLAGCVATLAVLHGPTLAPRSSAAAAPVAVASTAAESELRAVREERLAAEEERARTVRLLDEERERRIRAEEERDRALDERRTIPAPMVVAWPAPPPVMTQANLRAMLTQQLLQRMAMPMPMPMPMPPEPWSDAAP